MFFPVGIVHIPPDHSISSQENTEDATIQGTFVHNVIIDEITVDAMDRQEIIDPDLIIQDITVEVMDTQENIEPYIIVEEVTVAMAVDAEESLIDANLNFKSQKKKKQKICAS